MDCILNHFFWMLQTYYKQCWKDHSAALSTTVPNAQQVNSTSTLSVSSTTSTVLEFIANNGSTNSTQLPVHPAEHPAEVCEKPWSFVPPYILPTLWRVVYWTSQVLTWCVISYVTFRNQVSLSYNVMFCDVPTI